jgi:hypothetical protein
MRMRLADLDPALVASLGLAAALRLWGLGYDLPHVYNPDEVSILSRALSLARGDPNPHNFLYPSFYFYVLAAVVGAYFGLEYAVGRVDSAAGFERAFWADPSGVYLAARGASVAAGVLTVAAVYVLGRRIGGRGLARTAALFMAVAYIPARDAHFVKHDVPATLLIVAATIAAWHVREKGTLPSYVLAAALAGAAFATHYYAVFAIVPILCAHALARDGWRPIDRRLAAAGVVFLATFAALSPFVLLDWQTASRDIAGNRRIVVDRAIETYGYLGSGVEHLRLLAQGAGVPMCLAAIAGGVTLAARSSRLALWLFSFPLVFFAFIANSWPFGRSGNPLYPFVSIAAAAGVWHAALLTKRPRIAAAALIVACAGPPLVRIVILDRLMTREDTRTLARRWIETHLPDGAGVAIEPYSVPLSPTRGRLEEALTRNVGAADRAGYRARVQLRREPYPAPSFRITFLGAGSRDEDKIYVDAAAVEPDQAIEGLRREGVEYVVLKRFSPAESTPLRDRLARDARLLHLVSPFPNGGPADHVQLPDYDIPPSTSVSRPGPILEIWQLPR